MKRPRLRIPAHLLKQREHDLSASGYLTTSLYPYQHGFPRAQDVDIESTINGVVTRIRYRASISLL